MSRKLRELINGGIYHVYNRGNNRGELFAAAQDYEYFKMLLRNNKEKYGVDIFHYCLMPNHYHALLRVGQGEKLPAFMRTVQLGYARYFKRKRKCVGHVFQDRYRNPRIEEESYYLQCGRYIERNPVKAKMVVRAEDYRYSSARYYTQGVPDELITPNPYYLGMGKTEEERRRAYRKFVALDDPYGGIIDQYLKRV